MGLERAIKQIQELEVGGTLPRVSSRCIAMVACHQFITGKPLSHWLCSVVYCNCIVTRGGVYDEILPEPKVNPEGGARGISRIFYCIPE